MVTDAQEPWRSMLCLHTGNLRHEGCQFPLERDMAVSHLLLEHVSTWQWPHSVPVSPGQNPTEVLWALPGDVLCG